MGVNNKAKFIGCLCSALEETESLMRVVYKKNIAICICM